MHNACMEGTMYLLRTYILHTCTIQRTLRIAINIHCTYDKLECKKMKTTI